jgi:hypothetical protein
VVSWLVLLQLWTTHGLKLCSTHVLAHRQGQFDAVQLLPLRLVMHGRAQSVTSAVIRREEMARLDSIKLEVRILTVEARYGGLSSV